MRDACWDAANGGNEVHDIADEVDASSEISNSLMSPLSAKTSDLRMVTCSKPDATETVV